MGIESLLVFLIVGAIAGWLAGLLVKGYGFGLLGNIVVGIVGAFIAGWLLPALGISLGSGIVAAIIHAVIGAVILLVHYPACETRLTARHRNRLAAPMKQNQLYLIIGALAVVVIAFGIYVYREESKPDGVELRIDESGISVEQN